LTSLKNNTADIIWDFPDKEIEVRGLSVDQAISELYSIHAHIKTKDPALTFDDMIHSDARIILKCGDELADDRHFSGLITRFAKQRTQHGNLPTATRQTFLYDVEIRPRLWLLTRQFRSKVYQKVSVKDITAEILGEFNIPLKWELKGSPSTRDYCVQYQETDYAFISRLLEEEGICFFFDHKTGEVIFTDHPMGHPACSPKDSVNYVETTSAHFGFGKHESLDDFTYEQTVNTGKFSFAHKNYETSQKDLAVETTDGEGPCFPEMERYEHTRNYRDKGEVKTYVDFVREREVAAARIGRGMTNCRSFEAGHYVAIKNHFREELNTDWLLTSCLIQAEQGRYWCSFTAHPMKIPYRPACKTPRPKVYGVQTALITGPPGSKVYLDQLGRCKLQFHWDREGSNNDRSSMWVRVSNNYAGKDYGIQWIPRVGHEVLVTFLDGNPDHPVVTGRVYNDFNTAPLPPSKKFQNIIKSIKDNHIMFDDKDGAELVEIRAEKNMYTLVINNDSQQIGNDRMVTVGRNHREEIGNNMIITIADNLAETVGKNYTETVGENHALEIGKDFVTTVGQNQQLTVGKDQTIKVGGKSTMEVDKTLTQTVKKDIAIAGKENYSLDAKKKIQITAGNDLIIVGKKKGTLNVKDQLTIHVGKAKIILKKNGDIFIQGKKVSVKASSTVKIKGSKIGLN